VPVLTAHARVLFADPEASVADVKRSIRWFTELVGFATRRPAHTPWFAFDPYPDEVEGASYEKSDLPRFGRKTGSPLFQTATDLQRVIERGLTIPTQELQDRGIEQALIWQNLARSGAGIQYLDVLLLHQWVPLEILASAWAKQTGASVLLSKSQAKSVTRTITDWAITSQLSDGDATELTEKSIDLRRRPVRSVLVAFIRDRLGPFDAQPTGEDLDLLVARLLRARNKAVHEGRVRFEEFVGGRSEAWRDLQKLAGITERVLLAELGAYLPLLTEVPWTKHRTAS
jgi:hypothetical protein